jgi:hypothetical protein
VAFREHWQPPHQEKKQNGRVKVGIHLSGQPAILFENALCRWRETPSSGAKPNGQGCQADWDFNEDELRENKRIVKLYMRRKSLLMPSKPSMTWRGRYSTLTPAFFGKSETISLGERGRQPLGHIDEENVFVVVHEKEPCGLVDDTTPKRKPGNTILRRSRFFVLVVKSFCPDGAQQISPGQSAAA